MPLDPVSIGLYLDLAGKAYELFARLRQGAQDAGATDEQLAAITLDYDARIARRQSEGQDPDNG